MITIEEIKKALESGNIPIQNNLIKVGNIETRDGRDIEYNLHFGWDLAKCNACDREWGPYNLRLMEFISNQKYDQDKRNQILNEIQMDDDHWEWLVKALCYRNKSYHWFFLMAEGRQQAACLIYHPKKSAECDAEIFYVEYIAVAPWNRGNPMETKYLRGVGTLMISSIIEYVTHNLKFRHGFSLHALPRASGFYTKIGMRRFPQYDKDILQYFEMPEDVASKYLVSQ